MNWNIFKKEKKKTWVQWEKEQEELERKTKEAGKKGIIYCSAEYTNQQLAADEVEAMLQDGEELEDFVPRMYKEQYDMELFELI